MDDARSCLPAARNQKKDGAANAQKPLAVVGLSQSGLSKIGIPPNTLRTFPVAFQDGASAPTRSRVLRDVGPHAPPGWDWGGPSTPVDAVMLVYAPTPGALVNFANSQIPAPPDYGL